MTYKQCGQVEGIKFLFACKYFIYTALNTFDLLIGQGTTACTLLIRNGKCLELKSQYDSIFSS